MLLPLSRACQWLDQTHCITWESCHTRFLGPCGLVQSTQQHSWWCVDGLLSLRGFLLSVINLITVVSGPRPLPNHYIFWCRFPHRQINSQSLDIHFSFYSSGIQDKQCSVHCSYFIRAFTLWAIIFLALNLDLLHMQLCLSPNIQAHLAHHLNFVLNPSHAEVHRLPSVQTWDWAYILYSSCCLLVPKGCLKLRLPTVPTTCTPS